jgi:hypothetical protein
LGIINKKVDEGEKVKEKEDKDDKDRIKGKRK